MLKCGSKALFDVCQFKISEGLISLVNVQSRIFLSHLPRKEVEVSHSGVGSRQLLSVAVRFLFWEEFAPNQYPEGMDFAY